MKCSLKRRNIEFIIQRGQPDYVAVELSSDAAITIVDRGYLRIEREWRSKVSAYIGCPLIQVESNVIVPVQEASDREEYSAATFRPKILSKVDKYLIPLEENKPKHSSLNIGFKSFNIDDIEEALGKLNILRDVGRIKTLHGGTTEAKRQLKLFIAKKLDGYSNFRSDPSKDYFSNMSPYLHFGQISPLYIALEIMKTDSPGKDAYLEELVVRRELGVNFVYYNDNYDSISAIPDWAKRSLREHSQDFRPYVYSLADLENCRTHDLYWNACQKEMEKAGKMHGYMRMYWAKKIIEWSATPEDAFRKAVYLNDRYELDGRAPNSYSGIAWCFGKHDRAWPERPIFGKVRYMNSAGLKRKFEMDKYLYKINNFDAQSY